MKYLLDANTIIKRLAGHSKLLTRVSQHQADQFAISTVVACELFFGAYKSQKVKQNLARVEALQFTFLDFDKDDAQRAGAVRAELATAGTLIGPYDLLIAGQALSRNLILITHNTREFSRVSGLQIEDWEA